MDSLLWSVQCPMSSSHSLLCDSEYELCVVAFGLVLGAFRKARDSEER